MSTASSALFLYEVSTLSALVRFSFITSVLVAGPVFKSKLLSTRQYLLLVKVSGFLKCICLTVAV